MDVLMPQLGETVAEGKIVKWFKQAGDAVKPGDNLFEIETDKTSMEVPAIAAGTLTDIRFGVGEVAKVGAVLATIAGAGETAQPKPVETKPVEPPKAAPSPLTPAQQVRSTVLNKNAGVQKEARLDSRFRGNDRSVGRGDERSNGQASRDFSYPDMSLWREVRTPERNFGPAKLSTGSYVTPLARRLASERGIDLTRVSGSGPHGRIVAADIGDAPITGAAASVQFHLVADVEIGRLLAMQKEAGFAGAEFSLGDFIVKAWAASLARVTPDAGTDVGVMAHASGRLVTTIIRDAAGKSLTTIAREAREPAESADKGRATSAVHVLSTPGIREFTAVVTPPFSSILAAGQPRRAAVEAEDGSVKFVSQMTVTLSCDHRAVDSALGAELLAAFKTLIENPVAALV